MYQLCCVRIQAGKKPDASAPNHGSWIRKMAGPAPEEVMDNGMPENGMMNPW
jgi:hypothetical protein